MRFRHFLFLAVAACTSGPATEHHQAALQIGVDVDAIGTDATSGAYHEVVLPPHTTQLAACCGGQVAGACCLEPAVVPTPGHDQPTPTTASAGTIAVRDVTTSTDIGQVTYDPTTGYGYVSSLMPLWTAGDRIALDAPGDQLPAFSLELATPPAITGVTPALPLDTTMEPTITRGSDLVIRWTPATQGAMYVTFIPYFTIDRGNPSIHCSLPDAAGQLVIPGALLAFPNEAHVQTDALLELVRPLPAVETNDVRAIASAQISGYAQLTD